MTVSIVSLQVGGRPELADDPRFVNNPLRVQHRDTLVLILAEMVKLKSKSMDCRTWAAGVPVVLSIILMVFADPQVQAREMCIDFPLNCRQRTLVGSPIKISRDTGFPSSRALYWDKIPNRSSDAQTQRRTNRAATSTQSNQLSRGQQD